MRDASSHQDNPPRPLVKPPYFRLPDVYKPMGSCPLRIPLRLMILLAIITLPGCLAATNPDGGRNTVRWATFNASLNRSEAGRLVRDLSTPNDPRARKIAAIIQRVRPDILLINELDYDKAGRSAELFQQNYLGVGQSGLSPLNYPYRFTAPVNTGIASGLDLDGNGKIGDPGDALGYGAFPGQYGMAVYSKYPIDRARVRTFQSFLWKDMPGAMLPVDPETDKPFYRDSEQVLRLSSKSHWDLPINVHGRTIHFLVCHPTPPVFDGPEDRNGRRNHDEIRLWSDYIDPAKSRYIYDDQGKYGGLSQDAEFIVAGDLNADPVDGDSTDRAVRQLSDHPLIGAETVPSSAGGVQQSELQGLANTQHRGDPARDTSDFSDKSAGNLRVDYVLPSGSLSTAGSGVFWPMQDEEGFELLDASDHRLVWVDVRMK